MPLRYSWLALTLALLVALPATAQTRPAAPSLFPAEARRGGDEFPAYTAILTGANEVPATASTGGGYAFGDAQPDGSFTGGALVSGLTGPVQMAHVHQGAAGTNGPVILPATSISTIGDQTFIDFQGTLTADQQAALAAGELYVNVHTDAFPDGEVRGQLRATDSIDEARAAGVGATVSIFAYVQRAEGAFTYLTDETGGLTIRQTSGPWFDAVASGEITSGTVVRVTGTLSEFRGLLQINQTNATTNDLTDFEVGTDVGFNVNETAQIVTLEEIAADGEAFEGRLVVVTGATIAGSGPFAPGTSYPLDDGTTPASPVVLRVPSANDTAVDGLDIPTGPTTVLAIVGQFTTTEPTVGYQLLVIEPYDVAPTARLQMIHNSPDPSLSLVDVYIGGALALDDLAFRTASGLVEAPAYEDVTVEYPGIGESVLFGSNLAPGNPPLVAVVSGVLDPSQFSPNPDGIPTDLFVASYRASTERGAGRVGILGVQGAPDVPEADVRQGSIVIFDDVFYTDGQPFFGFPTPATLDLTAAADDGDLLARFSTTFAPFDGESVTVLTSGFLNPAANQNGPGLALLLVAEDGTVTVVPNMIVGAEASPSAALALGVAPNPAVGATTVTLALPAAGAATVEVFDALGRRVATLAQGEQAAGTTRLAVPGLAPGVYVVRATTATASATATLTVIR